MVANLRNDCAAENMEKRLDFRIPLVMLAFLTACGKDIRISGFESQKWKDDPNGCKGDREKVVQQLIAGRKSLAGASELEIREFLGKPDGHDIRSRGQKFFEYHVIGKRFCNPEDHSEPVTLRVRFDALDRVTEVAIY